MCAEKLYPVCRGCDPVKTKWIQMRWDGWAIRTLVYGRSACMESYGLVWCDRCWFECGWSVEVNQLTSVGPSVRPLPVTAQFLSDLSQIEAATSPTWWTDFRHVHLTLYLSRRRRRETVVDSVNPMSTVECHERSSIRRRPITYYELNSYDSWM